MKLAIKSFLIAFAFMMVSCFVTLALAGGFSVASSGLTTITVATSSIQLVAADQQRNYILIQNTGATNLIIKMVTAQTGSEGIIIPPGGSYEPIKAYRDAIFGKSASGSNSVTIIEGR